MAGLFIVLLVLGLAPAFVAKSKGRDFFTWYVYGVYLWIVALIHAITLKPYDEYKIAYEDKIQCSYCAEYVSKDASICKYCNNRLPQVSPQRYKLQKEQALKTIKEKNKKPFKIALIAAIAPFALGLTSSIVMMVIAMGFSMIN